MRAFSLSLLKLLRNFTLSNFLRRQDLGGAVTIATSKARTYVRARTKNYKLENFRKFEFVKQLVVPIKFLFSLNIGLLSTVWVFAHTYLNKQTEILVHISTFHKEL